ncbi:MAG: type I polyketide synthase [Caldilineaceae bacterium]
MTDLMTKQSEQQPAADALRKSLIVIQGLKKEIAALEAAKHEPIAIIGMGCRFPGGVNDPESFWQLLRQGRDAVGPIPPTRWAADAYYDPDPNTPGKMYVRDAAFLDPATQPVDHFDPQFFGISPREAAAMDPQQRLLLEVSWEALERAGQAPGALTNSQTGVFVGIGQNDYLQLSGLQDPAQIDVYTGAGNAFCFAAGRLAYMLGLQGPNLALDTACSSSLVAVHLACQSLRNGECTLALAGGVQLMLAPETLVALSRLRALAPDGRCKTFAATANGYGRGEGCGVVALKRLSHAQAAGDPILAVIRGSAINHDGPSSGLTVPNGQAQQALLRTALDQAKVEPSQIGYVEAHGTGTALGDPIEVEALDAVLGQGRPTDQPLLIGSAKTNIGHLEAAAGIAGLIKVVLSLQHGEVPPHLHFTAPNQHIPWEQVAVRVPTTPTPWPDQEHRIAGVSSFGISGANAHVILEAAPQPAPASGATGSIPTAAATAHLLTLSAQTKPALRALAQRYVAALAAAPETDLADLCYTAYQGRTHFNQRLSLVAADLDELRAQLAAFAAGEVAPGLHLGEAQLEPPTVAFLFTGQGAQYVNMGRELYESQPTFRATLDRCDALLREHLGESLLSILYPAASAGQADQSKIVNRQSSIDETGYTQPALFALEYALAELWQSWGVQPSVVMGHSVGEIVAACVAGVFSLEDGLKLIAARGRLMQALPQNGAMVAITTAVDEPVESTGLSLETQIQQLIAPYADQVSIAAINSPYNLVIAGHQDAIAEVVAQLQTETIAERAVTVNLKSKIVNLRVSHAFHSPLMEPMLADFAAVARTITYHRPQVTFISNLTGQVVTDAVTDPNYWVRHVRETVRFAAGVKTLHQQGIDAVIEIGPKPTLLAIGDWGLEITDQTPKRQSPITNHQSPITKLPSLRPNRKDRQQLLESLGALYCRGLVMPWDAVIATVEDTSRPRKIVLPTYPFQRQRYWVTMNKARARQASGVLSKQGKLHPLLDRCFQTPLQKERWFETQFSATALPFLVDHQIYGRIVVPGACHLTLLLGAAALIYPQRGCTLTNILFPQALILGATEERTVQLMLTPDGETATFQLISLNADAATANTTKNGEAAPTWVVHATGAITAGTPTQNATADLAAYRAACPNFMAGQTLYTALATRQIQLGPTFQWIDAIWTGADAVLCQMQPPAAATDWADYELYPGLIDSLFQLLAALIIDDLDAVYVPFTLERFHFVRQPEPGPLWCYGRLRPAADAASEKAQAQMTADLQLFDASGQLIAQVDGYSARRAEPTALLRMVEDEKVPTEWLYQLTWRLRASIPANGAVQTSGSWLILADRGGVGATLAAQLREQGAHCIELYAADAEPLPITGNQRATVDLADATALPQLLATLAAQTPAIGQVVHLWGLDLDPQKLATQAPDAALLSLLRTLAQWRAAPALKPAPRLPKLWVVTRNAMTVTDQERSPQSVAVAVVQATLWGLGKVIAQEHPDLWGGLIDLDGQGDAEASQRVVDTICHPGEEDQFALRGQQRYVPRLTRWQSPVPNGPVRAQLQGYGTLDNLQLTPMTRRTPQVGEVEIQVRAAGLNFRDVLNALGMLQEYYAEQLGVHDASAVPLGLECAGTVVAVGEGVTHLAVGDAVMGVVNGSFANYITVPATMMTLMPKGLTFAEAATLPLAFATAAYGLQHLAQLQAGESVLIHAAAGGVGQAAVQLAQRTGATVIGTASQGKWSHLHAQGVAHVFDSRTPDFGDAVLELTQGRGVDVVLNSLTGPLIDASVHALAPAGRFVEIGKLGIWDAAKMTAQRPAATYQPFDIGEVMRQDGALVPSLLAALTPHFATGALRPLPMTLFPATRLVDAFRFMQQAKHIGKVVLTFDPPASPALDAGGVYLITGGLGALGLATAQTLVTSGARQLVLTGRSGASATVQAALAELRAAGATVQVVQADIADRVAVEELVATCMAAGPLRGVIHAAGVLDDGLLVQQSSAQLAQVMAPKVLGAWHLHEVTLEQPLDFFLCYSSAAALLGGVGQGIYAAANAAMDALMQERRRLGLPGLSINWGPWAEIGMAARLGTDHQQRLTAQGLRLISPTQGQRLVAHLWGESAAQVGVLSLAWPTLRRQLGATWPPLLRELQQQQPVLDWASSTQPRQTPLIEFNAAQPDDRPQLLSDYLRRQVGRALAFETAQIEIQRPLHTFGVDSLMAVELRNQIKRDLGVDLPIAAFLESSGILSLADQLLEQLTADQEAQDMNNGSTNGHRNGHENGLSNGRTHSQSRRTVAATLAAQTLIEGEL